MKKTLKFLIGLLLFLCWLYCHLKWPGRHGLSRHIAREYGHYIKAGTAKPYSEPEGMVRYDPRTSMKWLEEDEQNSAESYYPSSKNK